MANLKAIARADESEREALFSLALGRILRLASRPEQPGDAAEYEEARAIIMTLAETASTGAPTMSKLSKKQRAAGRNAELTDDQRQAARAWLRTMVPEYEEQVGEVNRTKLGEDLANQQGLYCDDAEATIPEEVWTLVDEVASQHEEDE